MASVSMPGGGKRRKGRKAAPMAELNMIPFIDVMLVLLVIFMVAAPLLTVGVRWTCRKRARRSSTSSRSRFP